MTIEDERWLSGIFSTATIWALPITLAGIATIEAVKRLWHNFTTKGEDNE